MGVTTYTPSADSAEFESFAGQAFSDPLSYSTADPKRVDAKYFLYKVQNEILNLNRMAAGAIQIKVRNESGGSLAAGPVVLSGYSAANSAFLITDYAAVTSNPVVYLFSALADNSNGYARLAGALAWNTSGQAVGDPVYLDVYGRLAFSVATGARMITVGRVKTVSASGVIALHPPELGRIDADLIADSTITKVKCADSLKKYLLPLGTLVPCAASSLPSGWLLADGSAVSRADYSELFAAIGTTYGVGDGSSTFNLPDTQGRVIGGTGSGSGLTSRSAADVTGAETHVLDITEMPSHDHDFVGNFGGPINPAGSGSDSTLVGSSQITDPRGGGLAHNNMQPTLFVPMIIFAGDQAS